jgi:predicted lipoprotein with Yx(FWY)xxD motif
MGASALVVGALAASVLFAGGAGAQTPTTADTISAAKNGKLGTILVADNTVYTLKLGSKECTAACQKVWHAVVLPSGMTSATAGSGVDESKLGTTQTSSGDLQVTYNGKPLYWYAKDKSASDVKGTSSDTFGKAAVVVAAKPSSSSGGSGKTDTGTGGTAF